MSAPVVVTFGSIPNPAARRVMLARSGSIQQCFDGTASGTLMAGAASNLTGMCGGSGARRSWRKL